MNRLRKLISIVRALQVAAAVVLTVLVVKAIKLLYAALKEEGSL